MSRPRSQGFAGAGCDARAARFGGAWMTAHVITPPTSEQQRHGDPVGQADRARAPARRRPSTPGRGRSPTTGMAAGPPSSCAPTDAAMTLLTRDPREVRHVEQRRPRGRRPRTPSAARAAMTDGTPSLRPERRPARPRAASPPSRRPQISTSAAVGAELDGQAAPTCSVVATMFAPAKMMNRSTPDWRPRGGWNRRDVGCVHTRKSTSEAGRRVPGEGSPS